MAENLMTSLLIATVYDQKRKLSISKQPQYNFIFHILLTSKNAEKKILFTHQMEALFLCI
jgi:hypothetical protein